jgi:hypothetical protein
MADAPPPPDRVAGTSAADPAGEVPGPAGAYAGPAASPAGTAEPPARGFPGFPDGDPRQLPLSQRPRGLDAPPVPGGGDPELRETLARERPYVHLLVGMVAVIVGGSLILTFLAIISAAVLR